MLLLVASGLRDARPQSRRHRGRDAGLTSGCDARFRRRDFRPARPWAGVTLLRAGP